VVVAVKYGPWQSCATSIQVTFPVVGGGSGHHGVIGAMRIQLVVAVAKAAPIQNNIEKGKEEKVHCKKLVAALDIKKINNRKVFFVAILAPTMSDKPTSNKMKFFYSYS